MLTATQYSERFCSTFQAIFLQNFAPTVPTHSHSSFGEQILLQSSLSSQGMNVAHVAKLVAIVNNSITANKSLKQIWSTIIPNLSLFFFFSRETQLAHKCWINIECFQVMMMNGDLYPSCQLHPVLSFSSSDWDTLICKDYNAMDSVSWYVQSLKCHLLLCEKSDFR